MNNLITIYEDLKWEFDLFLHLYKRIKKEDLNKQDINDLVQNQQKRKDLDNRVQQYSKFIEEQQLQMKQLEQTIQRLQSKINNYDNVSSITLK